MPSMPTTTSPTIDRGRRHKIHLLTHSTNALTALLAVATLTGCQPSLIVRL